jgi:hypothetical protein
MEAIQSEVVGQKVPPHAISLMELAAKPAGSLEHIRYGVKLNLEVSREELLAFIEARGKFLRTPWIDLSFATHKSVGGARASAKNLVPEFLASGEVVAVTFQKCSKGQPSEAITTNFLEIR